MNDQFLRLTPDWVIRAVEAGGFEPTGHCLALNCLENRVYDLKLEDESHIVVKFYRPARWTKEAILEEHEFLADLREADIPVCAPLAFEDGQTLHEVEGIYYAVWPRTGGRSPSEFSDEQVEILGRLLARIHNVGAVKKAKHRKQLNEKTYALEPLEFLLSQGFLPPHLENRYKKQVQLLADIYRDRIKGVPQFRVHGDCHLGNLLLGREGWFFLDFDDFVTGPAVQDVWLLVGSRDEEGVRQRRLMIDAYCTFREFQPRWLSLVEPLRALRYIHYTAWIARRWKDPAFPAAFPHFNSEEYWQRETLDLEEQVRKILERAN
jgi:Ser/Thr protein kinase RdoA (MazF antagonist)